MDPETRGGSLTSFKKVGIIDVHACSGINFGRLKNLIYDHFRIFKSWTYALHATNCISICLTVQFMIRRIEEGCKLAEEAGVETFCIIYDR